MNFIRRATEPSCVCTCSDLHKDDICASVAGGCEDADEVMFDHATQFRCEVSPHHRTHDCEKPRLDMNYGQGDATYRAAGGEEGIARLVDYFYDTMKADYPAIWDWHPDDNTQSRDKLTRFLCGWMGGPRIYTEKYGPINIPGAHKHLKITSIERDQWLACMGKALNRMAYPETFKAYLLQQLSMPAERIRQQCASQEKPLHAALKSSHQL